MIIRHREPSNINVWAGLVANHEAINALIYYVPYAMWSGLPHL